MNKQNQIYRIMNYEPWAGMFSLLEIFIFLAGILATVFLFRFARIIDGISAPKMQGIGEWIPLINTILRLSVGFILITLSLILRRNRILQQSQMKQLEMEMEQRFRLNSALSIEQNKSSTLLMNWPDPIFVLDVHANVTYTNPAAAHLFGYSKPELLIGKNNVDFAPPELANEIREVNQRILKTGNPLINQEATILNQMTGKWQNLLITKVPFYDQDEQIAGLIVIGQDFTAQKQAEDALISANQKLSDGISELEQRTQEMDILTQLLDLLSACPSMEEAYKIIEDQLGKLNLADSGVLYLIRPSRNNLFQVAAWGQSVTDSPVFSPSECWGLRRGQLHITEFNPTTRQGDHHANPLICPHVSSTISADYLCLPLVAQGETLGTLHLRHYIGIKLTGVEETPAPWFTTQKIRWINMIAESLAVSIANLMLRSTLREQSIRDPLTGLFNRRYLEETLERELLRASRRNKKVGLMMVDIDHFKRFNDTYGHQAADAVLSMIGHLFLSIFRGEDLICRYGGEEFLILLSETNLETACQRAEEIREKVAQLNVQYQGLILEPINISIGVGIFPDHGQIPEALIRSVDQALYRAKNNGRNRVEIAVPSLTEHQPHPERAGKSKQKIITPMETTIH